jgi:hypothetical protein
MRPDIVYVVSEAVATEYMELSQREIPRNAVTDALFSKDTKMLYWGDSVAYQDYCKDKQENALTPEERKHWEMVADFGLRACCSPMSSVEVDGELMHRNEAALALDDDERTRLVIGAADTPKHQHGQANIPSRVKSHG